MNVLVIVLVLFGLNVLFDLILHWFALKGLQCARRFSVPAAHEGERMPDQVTISEILARAGVDEG